MGPLPALFPFLSPSLPVLTPCVFYLCLLWAFPTLPCIALLPCHLLPCLAACAAASCPTLCRAGAAPTGAGCGCGWQAPSANWFRHLLPPGCARGWEAPSAAHTARDAAALAGSQQDQEGWGDCRPALPAARQMSCSLLGAFA